MDLESGTMEPKWENRHKKMQAIYSTAKEGVKSNLRTLPHQTSYRKTNYITEKLTGHKTCTKPGQLRSRQQTNIPKSKETIYRRN